MSEAAGPWLFLSRLHARRSQTVKDEWYQARRSLQELQSQRDAAAERVEAMQDHRLALIAKIESQKAAQQVNITELLAAQRYLEDVQRNLDSLEKELTRCQTAVDNQEKMADELRQRMQLHDRKSAHYQDRNARFARYQANCQEESNDEEANEGLIARAYQAAKAPSPFNG